MQLTILRHARPINAGRLAGRRDIDADCRDEAPFAWLRDRIGRGERVLCSPARRCLQTAAALGLPDPETREALWEQDYGVWEGMAHDTLPDLGDLPLVGLARHRPEGGESFDDMVARVQPELAALSGDTLLIAHAGTVRAALAMVVGPAALAFSVAPLSLTVLRRAAGSWAVEAVNLTAP